MVKSPMGYGATTHVPDLHLRRLTDTSTRCRITRSDWVLGPSQNDTVFLTV